jgi:hypothetical protein
LKARNDAAAGRALELLLIVAILLTVIGWIFFDLLLKYNVALKFLLA